MGSRNENTLRDKIEELRDRKDARDKLIQQNPDVRTDKEIEYKIESLEWVLGKRHEL